MFGPLALAALLNVDPVATYRRAVAAMSSIPDPAYLTFSVELVTQHGSKRRETKAVDTERTADRQTQVQLSGEPGVENTVLPIPPDLFLYHLPAASAAPSTELRSGLDDPGTAPKTIASVEAVAVHYDVRVGDASSPASCAGAIHLVLTPLREQLKYNLRELWVRPDSYRICQAVALWHVPVITHYADVPVVLNVNEAGFVNEWHLTTTARLTFGAYTLEQYAKYSDIHPSGKDPQTQR